MSITIKENLITLSTKNTSYQMKVDSNGYLFHTYYGEKINDHDDMSYRIQRMDRGFSGNPYGIEDRGYSLDVLPQEYPTFGNGDYRADAISVIHEHGANTLELKFKGAKLIEGKYELSGLPHFSWNESEGDSLEVTLFDEVGGVEVLLYYGVLTDKDLITRAVAVKNVSGEKKILNKALSASIDFMDGKYDLIHFAGKHTLEREFERVNLSRGKFVVESKRGTSSHHHNPFVILADKNTTETSGYCMGMAFVYSGSFICETELDQIRQTRINMGLHPDQFSYNLEAGEILTLPEVVLSVSNVGFEKLTHSLHDAIRNHLQRGKFVHSHRPILINNWEGTYFDFDGNKLIEIAKKAANLDIEMLVMDDGWFGNRFDDNRALGDWYVNEEKLGMSLKELVDEVNKLGLKFGIWFEPEMASEDSILNREHPDYLIRVPNRLDPKSRNQYVLDFTRKDVRDYITKQMREVLDSANIEYVKWDMNRSIAAVYSANIPACDMGTFHYRYVLGLYDMLDELTREYPNVMFEGCSGGGGRFDLGMLYYHPQIWLSDDTDAVERLKIQYGSSFIYPIGTHGAHVSAVPNHQVFRTTPLETRATVAMAGSFGYELDLAKMSEEEAKIVKQQVADYKRYDEIVHEGDYFRLSGLYGTDRFVAWECLSKDRDFGLISVVVTRLEPNPDILYVYPRWHDKEINYEINGFIQSGQAFMRGGIVIPEVREEYHSFRFEVKRVK